MNDTLQSISQLKIRMRELVEQLRVDGPTVTDPQAYAILETSAEVLAGLVKTLDDYEKKTAVSRIRNQQDFFPPIRAPSQAFLKHFGSIR